MALIACALWGCGSKQTEPTEPVTEAPPPAATTPAEPAPPEASPSPEGSASPSPTAEAPPEPAPTAGTPEAGRVAFVTCEEPRKTACTREYRPVCGEVDTGIRCIKAPCPSSEKKTFPNGCTACAEPKVIGYFPMACDAMTTEKAP